MNARLYSEAYVERLSAGPFPGRIDPWAEVGRYFRQIHGNMISDLLRRLRLPLLRMGYVASRETSLQIAEQRQPDVAVWRTERAAEQDKGWNYAQAAVELLVEPGISIEWELPELDAVYIRHLESGELVTVVEVISPSNKADSEAIIEYAERRNRLVWGKGINLVEIDLTRSVKRLVQDIVVTAYAYHLAVFLPQESPRVIGMDFEEAPKNFALPLRSQAIVVDTRAVYEDAYVEASIAAQILNEGDYTEKRLPFPSLLNEHQRQEALAAVAAWKAQLERLRAK